MFGLSAGTIISLILGLLKFVNYMHSTLHDQGLIKQGADAQIAKELAAMSARSAALKKIDEKFAKMTPEEIVREIDQHHDFRD